MDREKGGGEGRGEARRKRRLCGGSRLWIFLIVGALLEVLGLIVGGIYLNVRSLTASLQHTEILPTYVPVAAVLLSGLLVLLLFWKRLHVLVFVTSVVSVGVGLLCAGTAVLMGTHIIRPMLHFVSCSMYQPGSECHCFSPYNRQQLSIEYSDKALTMYVYVNVTGCKTIESDLLQMLYALCAVYAVIFITSIMVTVLALLAYRTERIRKRHLEDESYEEIYAVSNESTPPTGREAAEQQGMVRQAGPSTSTARENQTEFIYSPSDIPIDYNEAVRMRRSHSFSQPRRPDQSFDSAESNTPYASSTLGRNEGRRQGEGQGRLKEHRKRTRRAVTLANLDTQQLMLILSLQMRYLQETEAEKQAAGRVSSQRKPDHPRRRAITPTPRQERLSSAGNYSDVDTKPVKMVRSHTPQPYQVHSQSAAQSLAFYENAGAHALIPPVDYENLDECVAHTKGARRKASSTGSSAAKPLQTPAERDVCSSKVGSAGQNRPKTTITKALVNGHIGSGARLPQRAKSYENVDEMSSSEESAVASSVRSDPVYENQARRDPLYENQVTARRRRPKYKSTDSSQSTCTSEVSADHPARPKSYINAVEGVQSSQEGAVDLSQIQAGTDVTRAGNSVFKGHLFAQSPMQSYPAHLMSSVPAFGSSSLTADSPAHSHDDSRLDLYARPKKKGRPLPHTPKGRNPSSLPPGSDSHKSAFHKVSRLPQPPSYTAPCDTDLDDLDPLPPQRSVPKKASKSLPPYSPPPSYECLSASRQSSLHSLTSCSSQATDDIDNELYKQIRKKKTGTKSQSGQQQPHRGSSQFLSSGQGQNGIHDRQGQMSQQGHLAPQDHGYQAYSSYYQGDHPGVHSYPIRKHHPPTQPQESYYVPMGPPGRPVIAKSYENLDDVFEPPPGQRSGVQGQPSSQYDINRNRMNYEGIIRLASGTEDDSDSEYMETVI